MLKLSLDLTGTALNCVRYALCHQKVTWIRAQKLHRQERMANDLIQFVHASRREGVCREGSRHFCPPPCCWACSFTDSSPRTLLAAMKLKGLVRNTE